MDVILTALFICLVVYLTGGLKYGFGILLSIVYSIGKFLNDVHTYKKDRIVDND